jgi:hypothetical protein
MAAGTQQGYLILADIAGYTAYLTGTELEHAQEILGTLLQRVLEACRPPLELVELEGDAVYVHLPSAEVGGEAVLEAIENVYFAFARQREVFEQAEPCVCRACRAVSTLDLKLIAHFGQYVLQRLAGRAKPIGPDVILVHRLLKNRITETTGLRAYAFLTDGALVRLGAAAAARGLRRHREEYEHLGAVEGAVYDLAARWAAARGRQVLRLDGRQARMRCSVEVPAPPEVVWAYLTRPCLRTQWEPAAPVRAAAPDDHGARGPTVVDWQPYTYFTCQQILDAPLRPRVLATVELVPTPVGTRVTWYWAAEGPRATLGLLLGQGTLRARATRLERLLRTAPPDLAPAASGA